MSIFVVKILSLDLQTESTRNRYTLEEKMNITSECISGCSADMVSHHETNNSHNNQSPDTILIVML